MTKIPVPATFGLVLAGGLARRMGGGKLAFPVRRLYRPP